jgi:hypothetical protein
MKFTRIVFSLAAAYGFIFLLPLYFMIEKVGKDAPPVVTHPELYYGFIGLALLWQVVFILIAKDPIRYRPLMPIAVAEKFVYTIPVVVLYASGQVHRNTLQTSFADPVFGLLFIVAYFRSANSQAQRES